MEKVISEAILSKTKQYVTICRIHDNGTFEFKIRKTKRGLVQIKLDPSFDHVSNVLYATTQDLANDMCRYFSLPTGQNFLKLFEIKSDSIPKSKSDSKSDSIPKSKSDSKLKSKSDPKSDPKSDSIPKSKSDPKLKSKSDPKSKTLTKKPCLRSPAPEGIHFNVPSISAWIL